MISYVLLLLVNLARMACYGVASFVLLATYILFLALIGTVLHIEWLLPHHWDWLNALAQQLHIVTPLNDTRGILLWTAILMVGGIILYALPITEWFIASAMNATPITSSQHSQSPIIARVYQAMCEEGGINPGKYKVYISENPEINAYAIGYHTIVVNTGFLDHLSTRALAGAIGHEMGHLVHKHTLVWPILQGMQLPIQVFAKAVNACIMMGNLLLGRIPIVNLVWLVFTFVPVILSLLYYRIVMPILSFVDLFLSRRFEYQADDYSYHLGYGDGLQEFFTAVLPTEVGESRWTNLWSTHPLIRNRLRRIQSK